MLFGRHINKYYKKYFWYFFFGILFLIFVDYIQLLIPEITGLLVDSISNGSATKELIIEQCIYILLIGGGMMLGRFMWRITLLTASIKIEADIRRDMFIHAEKMSQRYYQENKTGAMMALFTNDIEMVKDFFSDGTIMLIDAVFLGGMSMIKMYISNWSLALIASIPLFLLALCTGLVAKMMTKKYEQKQVAYEKLSDFAQESFTGISVIKAFVKEAHELREFAKINDENKEISISFVKLSLLLDLVIDGLIYSIVFIILTVAGWYIANPSGDKPFTIGQLTEFIGYFDIIVWPMLALAFIVNFRSRAKASLKRISALLDEKVEIFDKEISGEQEINGKITFQNFSFTYPGATEPVLKNINIVIESGERIGIVGKIGSGKTTLCNILLRLYNVPKGQVFIDDCDIMTIPLKSLRDGIGYVPQDNFLFSDKVRNNISFANRNVEFDEIVKAAEFSVIHENILDFPKQYETVSGERGVTLSGGQKQRISIARAIIKNPSILILDDSVSAVDLKTEERILKNINKERKGKTTLLIASRISTVQKLDKILVLNNGEVEAFGKHAELLKTSPVYKKMYELQELENELEGN